MIYGSNDVQCHNKMRFLGCRFVPSKIYVVHCLTFNDNWQRWWVWKPEVTLCTDLFKHSTPHTSVTSLFFVFFVCNYLYYLYRHSLLQRSNVIQDLLVHTEKQALYLTLSHCVQKFQTLVIIAHRPTLKIRQRRGSYSAVHSEKPTSTFFCSNPVCTVREEDTEGMKSG